MSGPFVIANKSVTGYLAQGRNPNAARYTLTREIEDAALFFDADQAASVLADAVSPERYHVVSLSEVVGTAKPL